MTGDKSFHDYVVHDLLGNISGIASRAMFGGWGIYKSKLIFGIIAGGELYFKVGIENRSEFERMGSHPFVYTGHKKPVTMSYWLVPEDVLEDRERLRDLMEKSVSITRKNSVTRPARRGGAAKPASPAGRRAGRRKGRARASPT